MMGERIVKATSLQADPTSVTTPPPGVCPVACGRETGGPAMDTLSTISEKIDGETTENH